MEFKFEPSQEYQLDAIAAAVGILEGQPLTRSQLVAPKGASFQVIPNRLELPEEILLENLRKVQAQQRIAPDAALQCIEAEIDGVGGAENVRFPNFSIEMETGTGKTYVYLRTVMELFRNFGLRKFIIVVPSIAVREGVLKTLHITHRHLAEYYGNPPYHFSIYDSGNLSQVRTFALSDGIEIMVMTIDAFARAENVIKIATDELQGDKPIHLIQAVRPVLILDEPQNMESENRVAALANLHPLFALRYSATHRNPYNVIYRLTPYDAYREGLVKRIEVASVIEQDNANLPFIRLEAIASAKRTLTARITVQRLMASGLVKEDAITVRPGDDLSEKTKRTEYEGFIVDEINLGAGFVRFANNVELRTGKAVGAEKEAIFEAQIRYTIEEHFRKQARYRDQGVKVLSLFFIDKVENFVNANGLIRTLYVKAFNEVKQKFPDWKDVDPLQAQASYFAAKKKRGGAVEFLDSTSGKTKEDEAAFNLIMRDKERLLSFDEPISFIFSHSALREGWDNPNVFQICTLREVGSETERRQQVGRGMRLAVNQAGDRLRDASVNLLTVVASEGYERFVAELQREIEAEYGKEGLPPPPPNARKRGTVKLRKQFLLKPEFKELWERIRYKTRYAVTIDTEKLINDVVPELSAASVPRPRVTVAKAEMRAAASEDMFEAIVQSGARTAIDLSGRYPLPNLLGIMEGLMENTSPPMRLSRKTLLEIYRRAKNREAALDNPHGYAFAAINIIKDKLADQLIGGIRYEKDGTWYEMSDFKEVIETWQEYIVSSEKIGGVGGTNLYDGAIWESEGIEKAFVLDLEKRADVKLYVKLPDWFTVDTPIGQYNPDWAIVMDNPEDGEPVLYLVRETKGSLDPSAWRPDERRKIVCGRRHFKDALGVDYRVVTSSSELPAGGA
jgi:type III restriction enzyme